MPQPLTATITRSVHPQAAMATELATVVYRSRAVRELNVPELHELTRAAQARNGREALTGLMLYDDSRFFQWLEGPADGLNRVMGSIRGDRRHTDIEILRDEPAKARAFGDWTMKLAAPATTVVSALPDVIKTPRKIVEDLRKRPQAAPVLLLKLLPHSDREAGLGGVAADSLARVPLARNTASILKSVILSAVIPRLADAHGARASDIRPMVAHPRAAELADVLVGTDPAASLDLIRELQVGMRSSGALYASLFEPAARALGDLWGEDACSELDVTLGMCRLQAAARLLSADILPSLPASMASRLHQPAVLIAPEPGELHRLGAALDSEVLWEAGWSPHCEYPADDKALQDLLSGEWIDVLDLSLSAAFRREHRLDRMRDTIARARRASRNPALVVVVGGRAFVETKTAGQDVGADLASKTALNIDRLMLDGLDEMANHLRAA
jgi:hypothetical protein